MGDYSVFKIREGLKLTSVFATLGGLIVGARMVYDFCYLTYEKTAAEKTAAEKKQKESNGGGGSSSGTSAAA